MKYRAFAISALAAVVFAGCSSNAGHTTAASSVTAGPSTAGASDNGRTIFQYGKDSAGKQIVAATKPLYPTCALCHHPNGEGGMHFPDGAVSADLRHKALIGSKPTYNVALLERAISTGIDNQNKKLDPVMPHWKLSKQDLHDVAVYVMSLK
jgi:mono/diheme cytochrome c family protein